MKRSEMVQKIEEVMHVCDGAYSYEEMSDMILTVVEKSGMLPPPSSTEAMYDTLTYAWYDECKGVDCEEGVYWESEDG